MDAVDVDISDIRSVRAYLEKIAATETPAVLARKVTELIAYMVAMRDAMAALLAEEMAADDEKHRDEA